MVVLFETPHKQPVLYTLMSNSGASNMTARTCAGEIEKKQSSYHWKVDNFVKLIKDGPILSPTFKMGTCDSARLWQLQLTLVEESPNDEYYVKCILKNLTRIEGYVEIAFVKFDDSHSELVGFHNLFVFKNTYTSTAGVQLHADRFMVKDYCRYRQVFIPQYLEIPFLFHDWDYRPAKFHSSDDEDSDSETLAQRVDAVNAFETLIDNKEFSDFEIHVDGKTLYAHKCILAVKSPVLASMFNNDMMEKVTSSMIVKDIKYEILQEMLRFMYTGRVRHFNKIAADLLYVAEKYQIEKLKILCVEKLIKNMSADNVIGHIHLADSYNNDKLKSKAVEFVVNNVKDVVEKPEFQQLAAQIPIFFEIFKAVALKK